MKKIILSVVVVAPLLTACSSSVDTFLSRPSVVEFLEDLIDDISVFCDDFEERFLNKDETHAQDAAVLEEEIYEMFIEEDTNIETPPPPPPSEQHKVPVLSDEIDIVDDEIEFEDDESLGVEIMDYVEEEVMEEEAIPFQLVEEKPSFQGGDANHFSKWVNSRLVYPEIAKENGVQGRVTLQFTVEKDGSVTKVRVLRGVDPSLDKEAVRVVSMSPKWEPGKQRDRAVPVAYTFPVIFQLR